MRPIPCPRATLMMVLFLMGGRTFCASAQTSGGRAKPDKALGAQVRAMVTEPAVARAHWGVMVIGLDGSMIFGLNEGQLFQPASNAKLFTTAAVMALLNEETTYTTRIVGRGTFSADGATLKGDLALVGDGDANLSGMTLPYLSPKQQQERLKQAPADVSAAPLRYLEDMADQVIASGLKNVDGDVVGDDTLFPWQPYPDDWVIDDAVWGYGAPVSALTINDNQLQVTVRPGAAPGGPASILVEPSAPAFYTINASALTTSAAKTGSHVQMERAPGSRILRVFGTIAVDAPPDVEDVAIEDPAEFAAMALKTMLQERGIRVTGSARARHRLSEDPAGFLSASAIPEAESKAWPKDMGLTNDVGGFVCSLRDLGMRVLATHKSPSLNDDVVLTNKVSQNLHAELMLEQLSRRYTCAPSRAEGAKIVRELLMRDVAVDPEDFVFYDGSGLSGHDLVTPRAITKLLVWATGKPWFENWKRSLPVGGEDGSLQTRFAAPALKDHVFAKTGTLGEARALSGYLLGAHGNTVAFSIMVGNHMPGTSADRVVMDRIVAAIAAAN